MDLTPKRLAQMRGRETVTADVKGGKIGLKPAPLTMIAAGRVLGLNAGDWSMIVLGLLLSGVLMALA
jgi:hypothetical protein